MREHERAQFSGMFYYVFGVVLVTALFPPAFAVLGIMQVPHPRPPRARRRPLHPCRQPSRCEQAALPAPAAQRAARRAATQTVTPCGARGAGRQLAVGDPAASLCGRAAAVLKPKDSKVRRGPAGLGAGRAEWEAGQGGRVGGGGGASCVIWW